MSLKIKLVSAISAFVLVLSMLLVGVYAASQTINLRGEIDFNIEDTTLYVKDIRLQTELTGAAETIENFMPGYINTTLDLNLGTIESSSGTVAIEIDMINTTATDYTATSDSTLQNASLEISGIVTGSSTPIEDITAAEISGTITLTIAYTGTTSVTLDGIALDFIEYVDTGIQVTLKGNYLHAYILGEGNTEIIETGASSSNPIETTISVPINTKICVIMEHQNYYGHEFNIDEIDWASENTFEVMFPTGEPAPSVSKFVLYMNGTKKAETSDGSFAYFYVIVSITETCTIEITNEPNLN